jgi:hypothetical protein
VPTHPAAGIRTGAAAKQRELQQPRLGNAATAVPRARLVDSEGDEGRKVERTQRN